MYVVTYAITLDFSIKEIVVILEYIYPIKYTKIEEEV